jgi:acyl-CoA thioester hydrolase
MARLTPPAGTFRFNRHVEVRFGDTDAMGHVNSAVYLAYFEAARAAYYRAVTGGMFGIGSDTHARSFIVAEARVVYRSPILFGEPLVAECRVAWVSRSAFGLEYLLSVESSTLAAGRLAAHGETVQVMYDYVAARPMPVPADLVGMFEAYEGRSIPPRPGG